MSVASVYTDDNMSSLFIFNGLPYDKMSKAKLRLPITGKRISFTYLKSSITSNGIKYSVTARRTKY